jgi:predicted acyltransferase
MQASQRFLSLDVFRGMTICLMIIVNTPGDYEHTFAPLLHAHWHGFTPTDLVFPSFLFAVGNAMSFVMPKWEGKTAGYVWGKILKRTAIIFLLGYLMYWFPFVHQNENGEWVANPVSDTRILGVLQRIALCYGIASVLVYYLKRKTLLWAGAFLLLLYWFLSAQYGDYTLTGNAARQLDIWLMGENHLYHGEGLAFDPEGWLSTLPAVVNVLAGYLAGEYIQRKGKSYEGLTHLLLAGLALLVLAHCWNYVFPINKKLWTSSFVLHTVALDCMILAAIIYWVELRQQQKGTVFFEIFGKNPLFIYLLSELLAIVLYTVQVTPGTSLFSWIYSHIFSYAGHYTGSLLFALSFMLTCWLAGWWLNRKRIYIRV